MKNFVFDALLFAAPMVVFFVVVKGYTLNLSQIVILALGAAFFAFFTGFLRRWFTALMYKRNKHYQSRGS
jgi:hypothetical protein